MKEQWKDVPDYEGRYQASNLGRVRSLLTNKILSPGLSYLGATKRPYKPTGVNFHKQHQKWCFRITRNQKRRHIGLYETKELALQARQDYLLKEVLL